MEIIKFYKNVEYDKMNYNNCTIEDYLTIKNYSDFFKYKHIYQYNLQLYEDARKIQGRQYHM